MLSEYLEGKRLVAFLKRQKLLFSHLPMNTFTGSYAQLAKNKASGVVKGVPDYVVVVPPVPPDTSEDAWDNVYADGKRGHVLFIELKKAKGGKLSKEQKVWIEALTAAGCPARVCLGADEAISFVKEFL